MNEFLTPVSCDALLLPLVHGLPRADQTQLLPARGLTLFQASFAPFARTRHAPADEHGLEAHGADAPTWVDTQDAQDRKLQLVSLQLLDHLWQRRVSRGLDEHLTASGAHVADAHHGPPRG